MSYGSSLVTAAPVLAPRRRRVRRASSSRAEIALWDQRLAKSAIAALEAAASDPATAAEAHEALGRIYTFKGWQQENVFPGWHDEPAFRDRALAELRAAVAADPDRASRRRTRCGSPKAFAAADKSGSRRRRRPEVRALDAKLQSLHARRTLAVTEIVAAVEARAKAQARSGAVLHRRANPDRSRRLRSRDRDGRARRGRIRPIHRREPERLPDDRESRRAPTRAAARRPRIWSAGRSS